MREQVDLRPPGLGLELRDQLVEPREQLLLDHLDPDGVEPARAGDGSGRSRVVLEHPHVAVGIAVLDESHLLGLELRAGADIPVDEDGGVVVGALLRLRWRCATEMRGHDERHDREAEPRRSPELHFPCQRKTRQLGQSVSNSPLDLAALIWRPAR